MDGPYPVNAAVPTHTTPGAAIPLSPSAGSRSSQSGLTIAVQ
jgi:hypothetical protein